MGSSAYVSSVRLVYRLDKVLVLQEIAFAIKHFIDYTYLSTPPDIYYSKLDVYIKCLVTIQGRDRCK